MVTTYKSIINTLVAEQNQFNQLKQKNGWVTEKKGIIVRKSEYLKYTDKVRPL